MSVEATRAIEHEDIVLHLRRCIDPSIDAVLLAGSFARGEQSASSDLDVYVVTDVVPSARKFYRWEEMGVDVDLWVVTADFLTSRFSQQPPLLHIFSTGLILVDDRSVLRRIVAEAKMRWLKGPPVLSEADVLKFRHRISTMLSDCEDLAASASPADASFAVLHTAFEVAQFHCRLHRLWLHRDPRLMLATIRRHSPMLSSLIDDVIAVPKPETKVALLKHLAAEVTKDVGGVLRYFEDHLI